ncbi:hypothetical protein DASC09_032410 [Saccharomycopsis crataegensis]|uniref:Mid2 domain-containing protein n=1 Tax=Saccharomycopsis crataegensis TaxID=43959 RepID=A0AAV5QMR4_9ASCO|nr:hypothetical protein DASC09_032410 [Saccharomycopsis crataegensis]
MIKALCLVLLLAYSPVSAEKHDKRYYINAADYGATTLPAYLTTGTDQWNKATLTTINWNTWDNTWATASTYDTTPTWDTTLTTATSWTSTSTSSSSSSTTSSTSTSSATSDSSTKNTAESQEQNSKDSRRAKIVVGVVCGIVGFLGLLAAVLMFLCWAQRRKAKLDDEKDITIKEVAGVPNYSNSRSLGPGAATGAIGAGVSGVAAIEVLGDDYHGNDDMERIESPINDNASTVTGSFASLSEKLKEIQEQYSNDGDNISTFSTLDGGDDDRYDDVVGGAADVVVTDATGNRLSHASSSSSSTNGSDRSSISSYRSSLKEVSPSLNNQTMRTMSPKQTTFAENVTSQNSSEAHESDDELYGDRKLDSSTSSDYEGRFSAADADAVAAAVPAASNTEKLSPMMQPRTNSESPATITTTSTSVPSGIDSDAASFEQDQNFPNKYNNFATELLTAKAGKPKLVLLNNPGQSVSEPLEPATEEDERKESITTIKDVSDSPQSNLSKKRESQFDFESGDDDDEDEDEEEQERERKPSEATFFTETV